MWTVCSGRSQAYNCENWQVDLGLITCLQNCGRYSSDEMTHQNREYGNAHDGACNPQHFAAKNGVTHGGQLSKAWGTYADVFNGRIAHGDPLGGNGS